MIAAFREKKIRFLCACNMISEGWDYPELGILVMARPTMSKVLYLQQIGRGLRRTSAKSHVFVIDVVDEYGAAVKPFSMHAIFKNSLYVPFGSILRRHFNDAVEICGLGEHRATVIGRLSRGVRARVALADAILHRPPVLLLDDPLASVDAAQRQTFLAALRNSAEERALLFATHTPDDAARLFTRVLLLDRGRLVLDAPLDPAHPPVSLGATVTGWLLDLAS